MIHVSLVLLLCPSKDNMALKMIIIGLIIDNY
jgi:hypothetical protein